MMCEKRRVMVKLSTENSPYKLINTQTGEVYDIELKPSRTFKPEWVKLFLACAEWLSKNPLSGESMRVLLFLISKTGYGNRVAVSQKAVEVELGMKQQNVGRAFRQLRDRDVLRKDGDGYTINPLLVWRGSDKARRVAISGRDADVPESLPVQPRLSLR